MININTRHLFRLHNPSQIMIIVILFIMVIVVFNTPGCSSKQKSFDTNELLGKDVLYETDMIFSENFNGVLYQNLGSGCYLIGKFKNGKPDGLINSFFKSGGKKSETIFSYVENNVHYKVKLFFENGKLQEEGQYINGKEEGEFRLYQKNKLKGTHNWKNGKLDGVQKVFYENGYLEIEAEYDNGIPSGEWIKYDRDGKVIRIVDCDKFDCYDFSKKYKFDK